MLGHSSVRRKIRVLPINNVLKWSFSILWKLPKVTGLNGYDKLLFVFSIHVTVAVAKAFLQEYW